MVSSALLFAPLLLGLAVANPMSAFSRNRIIGGEAMNITSAPYTVALLLDYYGEGQFYRINCGGSILTERIVVTAGHCVARYLASQLRVRAGSNFHESGGQLVDVLGTILHPEYEGVELDYDIALLLLSTPLRMDGVTLAPINMFQQDEEIKEGTEGLITGWGTKHEGGLLEESLLGAMIPIVSQSACISAYAPIGWLVTPRMVCAAKMPQGGVDGCAGDSGGPLVIGGRLAGLTSWGYGCGRPGFPGVWTRIPSVSKWVDDEMKMATQAFKKN